MIEELERVVNYVNDTDREWGPFLFLRPERHEPMTLVRVAQISALYGILAGAMVNAILRVMGERSEALSPLLFPLATTLGFFAIYRSTFAACWNRRAARLASGARE